MKDKRTAGLILGLGILAFSMLSPSVGLCADAKAPAPQAVQAPAASQEKPDPLKLTAASEEKLRALMQGETPESLLKDAQAQPSSKAPAEAAKTTPPDQAQTQTQGQAQAQPDPKQPLDDKTQDAQKVSGKEGEAAQAPKGEPAVEQPKSEETSLKLLEALPPAIKPMIMDKNAFTVTDSDIFGGLHRDAILKRAYGAGAPMRFGWEFFKSARERLTRDEGTELKPPMPPVAGQQPVLPLAPPAEAQAPNAMTTVLSPQKMLSPQVVASAPEQYYLIPGDILNVVYWASTVDPVQANLIVDPEGAVTIPKLGNIVVRGMTLQQVEKVMRESLKAISAKDLELVVSLGKLHSMRVFVTGEAIMPGSYEVSSLTSIFNILYAAGGPSPTGSLRDLKLIRRGKVTKVDLYDYLMHGVAENDMRLEPGDVVFIGPVGRTVTVVGEVKRPGSFELKEGETLSDALAMSLGVLSTAATDKVRVLTVEANLESKVLTVNAEKEKGLVLKDGDVVWLPKVDETVKNIVFMEGAVRSPGVYELKPGMKVSDLLEKGAQLRGDALKERAHLVRFNDDLRTTTLVPINIQGILNNQEGNDIALKPLDRVIVLAKWDVSYVPEPKVVADGAVQKPGIYARSEGMRVKDLLYMAGGALPNAFTVKIDLMRYDFGKESYKLHELDLDGIMKEDPAQNLVLSDWDTIKIHTKKEVAFTPEKRVSVLGAVQRPGDYPLLDGMTVNSLLAIAGGTLPNAYRELLEVNSFNFSTERYDIKRLNLDKVKAGDHEQNIPLKELDIVRVYTKQDLVFTQDKVVKIYGAVQKPGLYPRNEGMTLKDIINRAGGFLPGTLSKGVLTRMSTVTGKLEQREIELSEASLKNPLYDIPLEDEDLILVRRDRETFEKPWYVTLGGEVRYPGTYALTSRYVTLREVVSMAGGLTDLAYVKGTRFYRKAQFLVGQQQHDNIHSLDVLSRVINDMEFQRQAARFTYFAALDKTKGNPPSAMPNAGNIVSNDEKSGAKLLFAPGILANSTNALEKAVNIPTEEISVVTGARVISNRAPEPDELQLTYMDVEKALSPLDKSGDIILISGDEIQIPRTPVVVSMMGAVRQPTPIQYSKSWGLENYLNFVGGATVDSELERGVIIRANGIAVPLLKDSGFFGNSWNPIEPGDVVYIPTRVVTLEVTSTMEKVLETVRYGIVALGSIAGLVAVIAIL